MATPFINPSKKTNKNIETDDRGRRILNLDALIPEKLFVRLDGTDHEVHPLTVQMYLSVMKQQQRLKSADGEAAQMDQTVSLIALACPSITEKDKQRLYNLPLNVLTALADVVMEQVSSDEEDEGGLSDGEGTGE